MVFEVYSQGRTAAATRTILGTAMLLAGTVVLAAAMSHHRSTHVLGQRVSPPGWGWSFQPPQRFKPGPIGTDSAADGVRRYLGLGAGGIPVRLMVWHIEDHESDGAEAVARTLLNEFRLLRGVRSTEELTRRSHHPLGSAQGVQLLNTRIAAVVRAVEFHAGVVCAITMDVSGDSIDPKSLRIFEEVCRSVRFDTGA